MENIYNEINYYESEYYKILLHKNKLNEKFYITMNKNKIIIERVDSNCGWNQNLEIIVRDKNNELDHIIRVGSSDINIKYIDFENNEKSIKNHYENKLFKIFYISKIYNDVFKIEYDQDTKKIYIKRLDANEGWGQDLKLKYVEKNTNKEKIINIGKSDKPYLTVNIDLDNISYRPYINYYESENYKIKLYENKYPDIFQIFFYEETSTIYIKRLDVIKDIGWGQLLFLSVYDIKKNNYFIIYIGDSTKNELYRKVELIKRKCNVALTTIPSRAKTNIFIKNILHLVDSQTYTIENIFITIPDKYNRFKETVSEDIINQLLEIPKVKVICSEIDYGPASKYLGPLINYYDELKDTLLIVIDDDRIYNENLLKNFVIAYNSFPKVTFSSGLWTEYFGKNYKNTDHNFLQINLYKETNNNKLFYGQGVGGFFGFCIKVENENLQKFIEYNLWILTRIPKSFYHDEGIILGYLKFNEETIMYLKHYGCNYIENEMQDALCTSNLVNRGIVEREILQLSNLESI
jgi:hypothetical protein